MTKVLGMTKSYEKVKRFLESEKKKRLRIHQITPLATTTLKSTNKNLETISIRACYSIEKIRNVQINYQKIDNVQKNELSTKETLKERMQPKIINLSKHQFTKFQISLLTKRPKFCPTTKENAFDIKFDAKAFSMKFKLREIFENQI